MSPIQSPNFAHGSRTKPFIRPDSIFRSPGSNQEPDLALLNVIRFIRPGRVTLPLRQLLERLTQMDQEEVLDRAIGLDHLQVIVNGDVPDNRYLRVPPSLFGVQLYFGDRNLPRRLLGGTLKGVWLEEKASVGEIEDSTDRTAYSRIHG